MRRRPLIVVICLMLTAVIAAGLALGPKDRSQHGFRTMPALRPPSLPEDVDAPMDEVLAMHKAVRLAKRRFDGRVLDITLVPPGAAERAAGVELVYQLRMVSPARDVLDVRMDALNGRFLDLRGADLTAVRRKIRKDKDD